MSAELRDARNKAGLSLDEASKRTRIPTRYLEALEKGDLSIFPPGPFLGGYTRQYRSFLGLPESSAAAAPAFDVEATPAEAIRREPERRRAPRRGPLRAFLFGALVLVAVVLAARIGEVALSDESAALGVPPDQVLHVTVVEPVRAEVLADGRQVFSGKLPPGQQQRFEAHDRLEISIDALEGVALAYNGKPLRPLGAMSRPRRLVFIDDADG